MAMLSLKNLHKSFGSVVVADAIDLAVESGEAVGIIGPNGAGKSSLFNLIAGTLQADDGSIHFADKDVTAKSATERCKLGIARSYQIPQPFSGLTVFENLLVAATFGQNKHEAEVTDQCAEVLQRTGLWSRANQVSGTLSLLDRKRLELARALATSPELLLLDEIAGGLTEGECAQLVETILDLKQQGTTIVWIEHIVHALLAVVDRITVLNFGQKIIEGEPKEIMASDEVREIYMGMAV